MPISQKVYYHLHLVRHEASKDAESSKQYLSESDIYFPECIGWNQDYQDYYNRISHDGLANLDEIAAQKGLSDTFNTQILRYLNKSQIEVRFADIPDGHAITKKMLDLDIMQSIRKMFDLADNYEGLLKAAKEQFNEQVTLDNERENYIVEHLEPNVQSALTLQAFKDKKIVHVLLTMGNSHQDLYNKLVSRYKNVTVSGNVKHEDRTFIQQYRVNIKRGQTPDTELLARGLFYELLKIMIVNQRLNSSSADLEIAKAASIEQIKSLFDAMYSKQPDAVGSVLADLLQLKP